MKALIAPILVLIWAGVSLGGSLIAAPAKFQAPSLSLSTALEVGQAQFRWMGVTEAILCTGMIISLFLGPTAHWKWMVAPVALFAIQRLAVMPTLDARTLEVIDGAPAGETSLHLIYIVLEGLKFFALIAVASLSLHSMLVAP